MNLVFDIGNTLCKVAVFSNDELLENGSAAFSLSFIESWIGKYPAAKMAYSSVKKHDAKEVDFFQKAGMVHIKDFGQVPIPSLYKTVDSLGDDRWAAVCAGAFLSKGMNPFMVIQVGTAMTFDQTDEKGQYIGGAISPGINMRFKALHNFTGKLPLVLPEDNFPLIGASTNDSILSGVMNGCLAEINYRIDVFRNINSESPIYVGGGDSRYFDICGKNNIFAVPNIVLVGLNYLLKMNS